jgi:hypothetical protein
MRGGVLSSWAARTGRRAALVVGAGAMVALSAGAVGTAPAVQAAPAALHMQPVHLTNLGGRAGPGGQAGPSAASSSVCWESSNWSGYAVDATAPQGASCSWPYTTKTYSSVSATWTVPTVTSSSSGFLGSLSSTYSAVWTGIDGFSDDDLIQAGTEQDVVRGKAQYSAWYEILPAAETTISSITVKPGDQITVSIVKGGCSSVSNPWLITLTDATADGAGRGSPSSTCVAYTGPQSSAEWIVEAPEVNGRIATLADYGTATLGSPSVLTINGTTDPYLVSGSGGEMVHSGLFSSSVVSVPGSPTGGDEFSCTYQ